MIAMCLTKSLVPQLTVETKALNVTFLVRKQLNLKVVNALKHM